MTLDNVLDMVSTIDQNGHDKIQKIVIFQYSEKKQSEIIANASQGNNQYQFNLLIGKNEMEKTKCIMCTLHMSPAHALTTGEYYIV